MLNPKERKIMKTFSDAIPKLTPNQQSELLGIAKGIALAKQKEKGQQDEEKQPA
jgi:hypothetical protein